MINVLHLGLSYACNMRCKHCFVKKQTDFLSTNIIKKVLNTLVDEFGLFIVYYTYGEPLLATNFYEVAEYADKLGLVQILMSNGSLITENEIEKIKNANISQVYISLDSASPNHHDCNRGVIGSYQQAVRAIELLTNAGVNVGIATTLRQSNLAELDEIYNIAVNCNVPVFSLLRERTHGQILPLDNVQSYYDFIEKQLTTNAQCNLLLHDPTIIPFVDELYESGKISLCVRDKYITMNSCHYNTTLAITPSGDVSHCNLCSVNLGNVLAEEIKVILKKEIEKEKKYECAICCTGFSRTCT